jgi:4-amino-4-deoxy-L-arabinose transferase-like glycosyltransferase
VIWHFYHKNESLPYYEDTRHPLFPVFLSGLANITGIGMQPAQWLNILFNLISILIVFLLGKRIHSVNTGLFASFLMAISWPQIKYSAHVYSEILFELIVLVIVFFYCTMANGKKSNKNWLIIGLFLGLSYLCRPNGIFLFAAAAIIALLYNKKSLIWISIGFLFISSWWMIRNSILFGNPLYGHFNYFMWIDNHQELWYRISDAPPSLVSFLQSHSIGEIIGKFYKGLSGLFSELWKFEGINLPLYKILFPFFIWFLIRKKFKKTIWIFISLYFLITLLPVIWTASVIWVARYLLIYYPFYFLAVSIGIFEIEWLQFKIGKVKLLIPAILVVIALFQYYPLRFLTSERNGDIKEHSAIKNQVDWIKNNTGKNAVILTGSLTQCQYAINRYMIQYPIQEPLEKVIHFSKKHRVTDFIIDKKLVSDAKILKNYWDINNNRIVEKELPDYLESLHLSDDFGVYKVKF